MRQYELRRSSEILFDQVESAVHGLKTEVANHRGRRSFDSLRTFMDARIELIKDMLLAIEQLEKAG